MVLVDSSMDDIGRPVSDRLVNLASSGQWFEEKTGARTDASGRWNYRTSIFLIVAASLALWAGIYVVARVLF